MSMSRNENPHEALDAGELSAAERFRTHLRWRLAEMREHARNIGASSSYLDQLDRNSAALLASLAHHDDRRKGSDSDLIQ